MPELDERKQRILRAMIVEYISAAEPVGSELLATKYEFGVRSATIRNELAELAEKGFLEQPHTSAGRIPSDTGYRYYVDHMIVKSAPDQNVRHRLLGASEEGEALKELLQGTTKVLSRLTQLLSAATIVPASNIRVRNAIVTALGPERLLLVVVLSNGHVENRLLECPRDVTLSEIGRSNEIISDLVAGQTIRTISRLKNPATPESQPLSRLLSTIAGSMRQIGKDLLKPDVVFEGEEFLLSQPEIRRDVALFQELVHALGDSETVQSALVGPADQEQTVTIGKEHQSKPLRPFTVVKQSFYVGQDEAGTLAIIGPTRMDYDASISLLDFTAKAISETLTKIMK